MKKWIITLIALMAAVAVQADVIADWDNNDLAGNEAGPIAADSTGSNVDSASLARGAGSTASAYQNTLAMRHRDSASLADAITNDRYFSVSVSAASGYQLNLTNLFVRTEANNITDGAQFAVLSDKTGLTAGDELYSIDLYDGGSGPGQFSTHTIDLSGTTALQGVTSAEFRIYTWGAGSQYNAFAIGRGFNSTAQSDLTFEGTVTVVPEPATVGMLGLGALVSLLVRRIRG